MSTVEEPRNTAAVSCPAQGMCAQHALPRIRMALLFDDLPRWNTHETLGTRVACRHPLQEECVRASIKAEHKDAMKPAGIAHFRRVEDARIVAGQWTFALPQGGLAREELKTKSTVKYSDECVANCCSLKNRGANLNLVRQARRGAASREKKACKARTSLLVWQMGTGREER
jgi:hypothetical protein